MSFPSSIIFCRPLQETMVNILPPIRKLIESVIPAPLSPILSLHVMFHYIIFKLLPGQEFLLFLILYKWNRFHYVHLPKVNSATCQDRIIITLPSILSHLSLLCIQLSDWSLNPDPLSCTSMEPILPKIILVIVALHTKWSTVLYVDSNPFNKKEGLCSRRQETIIKGVGAERT